MASAALQLIGHPAFDVYADGTNYSVANFTLDATDDAVAAVFQADAALTITQVGMRYGARTGTPPTYRISLQAVDATSGQPSGTPLGGGSPASVTFTPPATTAWDGLFQWFTLANAYACSRGQVLAVVVDYSAGTINASNCSSFTYQRTSAINSCGFPFSWTNNSTTWARTGRMPVFGYRTASASYGMPLNAMTNTLYAANTSVADEWGMAFTLPADWGETYQVAGVYCGTRVATGGSLVIKLYTGTTALQTLTVDGDQLGQVNDAPHRFMFPDATLSTLNYGTLYRVALKSGDNSNVSFKQLTTPAAQDAAAWAGGSAFYSTSRLDDGAWTDDTASRPLMALILADITEPTGGGGSVIIQMPAV